MAASPVGLPPLSYHSATTLLRPAIGWHSSMFQEACLTTGGMPGSEPSAAGRMELKRPSADTLRPRLRPAACWSGPGRV